LTNRQISFKINGLKQDVLVEPWMTLVHVLREKLDLVGAKEPCGVGECGSCTVLVDNKPINSCLMLAVDAHGKDILTLEGLADRGKLHPLQESFISEGAIQCGMCTGGFILSAKSLLEKKARPTEEEIRWHLDGHICRCTGYNSIIRAVLKASDREGM